MKKKLIVSRFRIACEILVTIMGVLVIGVLIAYGDTVLFNVFSQYWPIVVGIFTIFTVLSCWDDYLNEQILKKYSDSI